VQQEGDAVIGTFWRIGSPSSGLASEGWKAALGEPFLDTRLPLPEAGASNMHSKLINDTAGEQTYAVILETGDEVAASLNSFALENGLTAASVSAIGAFSEAELAFFDWEEKSYLPIPVNEQVEVASMTGDIVIDHDGQPAVHIHVVLSKRDGSCVAGHLQSGVVRPTLEIVVTEAPAHLKKRFDPETGLAFIDPDR
jgi:predicted DNA-binding protein with PD1-like motif